MFDKNNENDSNDLKKVFKTNKIVSFLHCSVGFLGGGQRGQAGLTRR